MFHYLHLLHFLAAAHTLRFPPLTAQAAMPSQIASMDMQLVLVPRSKREEASLGK